MAAMPRSPTPPPKSVTDFASSNSAKRKFGEIDDDDDDDSLSHCPDGAKCDRPTCFMMHPCTGSNCGCRGKRWLPWDRFKYNIKKRFKTCIAMREHNQTHCNAETTERKRKEREEHELANHPKLKLSVEAKAAAVASAISLFDAELAHARQQYPNRVLSCNVFGASTGSQGYSIVQEGNTSTLTERGYDIPAIVAPSSSLSRGWRALSGPERRDLGPPAATVFDAGLSKEMSKHVEHQLQLHVEQLPGIKPLWRVPGAGGPKGIPPYCVGVRFIPHEEDGSLPHDFYHTF